MRRGVGVSGVKRVAESKSQYKSIANQIEQTQIQYLSNQLSQFKSNLESFAGKYKTEINANPIFRRQFQEMCINIGVDPLASNKGFWSNLLGLGDFYYELSVQIADIAIKTRKSNGGLISMDELLCYIKKLRSINDINNISEYDIIQAANKLTCLGNGFNIIKLPNNNKTMIVSVPTELNTDHINILELATSNNGHLNLSYIKLKLSNWTIQRIDNIIQLMIKQGMIWIDNYNNNIEYWFPSLYLQQLAVNGYLNTDK